jgi:hypothetical protein
MLYSPFFVSFVNLFLSGVRSHSEHLFLPIFDAMFSRHDFIFLLPRASWAKHWFSHFAGWNLGRS